MQEVLIRTSTPDDYQPTVTIYNTCWKGAHMTADQVRASDEEARRHPESFSQRYVVEQDERIVGFGYYDQPPRFYEPYRFRVMICVEPQYQRRSIGSALYERISEDMHALKARSIWVKIREDMLSGLHFVQKYGFFEELYVWELHLDTSSFDPRPFAELEFALQAQGITIKTLQELASDTERYQKLYRLSCEVGQDLPPTEHWVQPSYDDFLREMQSRPEESYFVALHEHNYIGLSYLSAPKENGVCATGLTGVKRAFRRQRIALALKLRGIAYAREHACTTLTTTVDSSNQASLSMNERMSFVKRHTWIVFAKTLSPSCLI